jgi:hypothetical protein
MMPDFIIQFMQLGGAVSERELRRILEIAPLAD